MRATTTMPRGETAERLVVERLRAVVERMLSIGATRARQHLVVVGPAAVLERLR